MSAAELAPEWISIENYLTAERAAPTKNEWYRGVVYAMTGASLRHNQITFNLTAILGAQLRGGHCQGFAADMRVKAGGEEDPLYAYPDLAIVCAPEGPRLEDPAKDTLLNPTVIIEVISPSTERFDRSEKAAAYRRIPTLREYAFVSQTRPFIEHYSRQPTTARDTPDQWLLTEVSGLNATLSLPSANCSVALSDLYENVALSPEQTV